MMPPPHVGGTSETGGGRERGRERKDTGEECRGGGDGSCVNVVNPERVGWRRGGRRGGRGDPPQTLPESDEMEARERKEEGGGGRRRIGVRRAL
eukprot:776005-Rhodomonas_salina.1